jgi:hypothetical protein
MGDNAPVAAAAPMAPAIPPRPSGSAAPVILIPSSSSLRRRGWIGTWVVILFASAAAAASALLVLYHPNYAWGDWDDLLIAALWGLGVHAVTNLGYEGVTAISEKFGGGS